MRGDVGEVARGSTTLEALRWKRALVLGDVDPHGNGLVAREADGGAPAALAGAPDSDADMLACARAPAATCRCS